MTTETVKNTSQESKSKTYYLNPKHKKELLERRGLNREWIEVNCRSINSKQASDFLGYQSQSDGIWLEGDNFQGQLRPDKPWKAEKEKGKAPKYRSGLGEYDAMLPIHPTISNYWVDLDALKLHCYQIDGHPCLVATEGFFKAIAGCSNGIPTIALLGVEMGLTPGKADPQGKRYLVPTLERFAKAGFGFIICFDADAATNENVLKAQLKLAHQFKKFQVPVYSVTALWEKDSSYKNENKGMDDYIQNHGADKFRQEVLARAQTIEQWEKQFVDTPTEEAPTTQASVAAELAEKHRPQLAWHIGNKSWYQYEFKLSGVWSEIADELVGRLVVTELQNKIGNTFKNDFVSGTIKLLKYQLAVNDWEEAIGLIPMQDGVLDPIKMKIIPHSPGYRFLWQLPYRWQDRIIGCQPVVNWLTEAMNGDELLVQLLRAYLKAVVVGRCDLHRFLECIGAGGTGKSTFQRLATDLVGKENTIITTLKQLEGNRFETAALYGKRLALITDSERYGGDVSTLKAITGEDEVRNERKGIQQTKGFRFSGMVIVAANEPIQSSDYTSGLKRRRLTVPFNHQILPHLRRDLNKEFKPYLPGLLEWVLLLPDQEVEKLVRDTENSVHSLANYNAEFLLETNPLADWMNDCLVWDKDAKTYVGILGRDINQYLYPNYCSWMQNTGGKSLSLRRFSGSLVDLCRSQLKREGIAKGRDEKGAYIAGISLRLPGISSPRPITGTDGLIINPDESLTGQTRTTDGSDGYDGLIPSAMVEKNKKNKISKTLEGNESDNASYSTDPSVVSIPANSNSIPLTDKSIIDQPQTNSNNKSENAETRTTDGLIQDRVPVVPELPSVGSWVEVKDEFSGQSKLAQVTEHLDWEDRVSLDGKDKSYIFGTYAPGAYRVLSKHEMLEKGLSTKLK